MFCEDNHVNIDLELHQLNMKTTFLNRELKEDIYMIKTKDFK